MRWQLLVSATGFPIDDGVLDGPRFHLELFKELTTLNYTGGYDLGLSGGGSLRCGIKHDEAAEILDLSAALGENVVGELSVERELMVELAEERRLEDWVIKSKLISIEHLCFQLNTISGKNYEYCIGRDFISETKNGRKIVVEAATQDKDDLLIRDSGEIIRTFSGEGLQFTIYYRCSTSRVLSTSVITRDTELEHHILTISGAQFCDWRTPKIYPFGEDPRFGTVNLEDDSTGYPTESMEYKSWAVEALQRMPTVEYAKGNSRTWLSYNPLYETFDDLRTDRQKAFKTAIGAVMGLITDEKSEGEVDIPTGLRFIDYPAGTAITSDLFPLSSPIKNINALLLPLEGRCGLSKMIGTSNYQVCYPAGVRKHIYDARDLSRRASVVLGQLGHEPLELHYADLGVNETLANKSPYLILDFEKFDDLTNSQNKGIIRNLVIVGSDQEAYEWLRNFIRRSTSSPRLAKNRRQTSHSVERKNGLMSGEGWYLSAGHSSDMFTMVIPEDKEHTGTRRTKYDPGFEFSPVQRHVLHDEVPSPPKDPIGPFYQKGNPVSYPHASLEIIRLAHVSQAVLDSPHDYRSDGWNQAMVTPHGLGQYGIALHLGPGDLCHRRFIEEVRYEVVVFFFCPPENGHREQAIAAAKEGKLHVVDVINTEDCVTTVWVAANEVCALPQGNIQPPAKIIGASCVIRDTLDAEESNSAYESAYVPDKEPEHLQPDPRSMWRVPLSWTSAKVASIDTSKRVTGSPNVIDQLTDHSSGIRHPDQRNPFALPNAGQGKFAIRDSTALKKWPGLVQRSVCWMRDMANGSYFVINVEEDAQATALSVLNQRLGDGESLKSLVNIPHALIVQLEGLSQKSMGRYEEPVVPPSATPSGHSSSYIAANTWLMDWEGGADRLPLDTPVGRVTKTKPALLKSFYHVPISELGMNVQGKCEPITVKNWEYQPHTRMSPAVNSLLIGGVLVAVPPILGVAL